MAKRPRRAIVDQYQARIDEIPGASPYKEPKLYFQKDDTGTLRLKKGRRFSPIILVPYLRKNLTKWRNNKYPGLSDVGKKLFSHWFDSNHIISDGVSFNYYFCQREAIETFVYIVEILKAKDLKEIITKKLPKQKKGALGDAYEFGTIEKSNGEVDDTIMLFPEKNTYLLSKEGLLRLAFKMATGSGKTFVMALAIVYCYFKNVIEPNPEFPKDFLIIAPGIPVYKRLIMDFENRVAFNKYQMIPDEWIDDWDINIILKDDKAPPSALGNIYLANIQHLTAQRQERKLSPMQRILGKKATKRSSKYSLSTLDKVKSSIQLMILNDEAHRVNQQDPPLKWEETLNEIHNHIKLKNSKGLFAWLDFTATPKNQDGSFFPWIIIDYPLVQAIEDITVKRPIIIHKLDIPDPTGVTQNNIQVKYKPWIDVALSRWDEHYQYYEKLGKKVVLFIMTEKTVYANKVAEYVKETKHLTDEEILIIHTNAEGYVKQGEHALLDLANQIDSPDNKIKVIVSVLMLKEGWNVKNVTIILGLRAFASVTLPEQSIGRGLRIMTNLIPSERQYLEVIGTKNFENFINTLKNEDVDIPTFTDPPVPPVNIEVVKSKIAQYDIAIPTTYPKITITYRTLFKIDATKIKTLDLTKISSSAHFVKIEDIITNKELLKHVKLKSLAEDLIHQIYFTHITNQLLRQTSITCYFSDGYRLVKKYILENVFQTHIVTKKTDQTEYLRNLDFQQGVLEILRTKIHETSDEQSTLTIKSTVYKLSDTKRFRWSRTDGITPCNKTIFNYISGFNKLEKEFAEFVDKCPDILRFAKLPEKTSDFFIEYINSEGGVGFYYPDFVLVQKNKSGKIINWIFETKGREDENVALKDAATIEWCANVTAELKEDWQYLKVPDQTFRSNRASLTDFQSLVDLLTP